MIDLEYALLIEEYIEQNLDGALLARCSEDTYNKINKERENLELYRNMVLNPELRKQIIDKMISYTMGNLTASNKTILPDDARINYYMNSVKTFLNPYQMVLLAKKFNQEIQNKKIR